jgi:hypothetical protein
MRNVMAVQERVYTTEDLRAIEALPENRDKRFELIGGAIYEVPYPKYNQIEVVR